MYFHQNIHFQRRKRRSCNWSVRLLLDSIKQSFPRFPGDELDDEGQTWHESSLLQPEDGGQTSLNWGKNHNPLSMSGILGVDPLQSPVRLLLDSGEVLNGVEQPVPLLPVLDVGVDEQAVHLAVDVLTGDLQAVEASGLRDLNNFSTRFSLTIPQKLWRKREHEIWSISHHPSTSHSNLSNPKKNEAC